MATFGRTSSSGASPAHAGDRALYVCKFTSPADVGLISSITAYVASNIAGSTLARAVIYSDNGGLPQNLLAVGTTEMSISTSPAMVTFPISFTPNPNTPYWIGIMTNASTDYYFVAGATNQFDLSPASFTYPTAPSTFPYPSDFITSREAVFYATYAASAPSRTATLTFACAPLHGTLPWIATFSGTLRNASNAGIPTAPIMFQSSTDNGVTWYDVLSAPIYTDTAGAYSVPVTFEEDGGWVAGTSGLVRASFAGDANYDATTSTPVTVTMDAVVPSTWSLTLSASPVAGGSVGATALSGNVGASTTVTATPSTANGYVFLQWVYDGTVLVSTANPLTLTPTTGAHTLQAVFTLGGGVATFGYTTAGTARRYTGTYTVYGCKFVSPSVYATVSKLTAYLEPNVAGITVRAVIYADNSGLPGALLAQGNVDVSIPSLGWYDLPISLNIPPNTTCWLGIISNASTFFYADTSTTTQSTMDSEHFTYPTAPTPFPYPSSSLTSQVLSVYATYFTGTEPPTGTLTISVSPAGSGTVSPAGPISGYEGTAYTVTASPIGANSFVQWLLDGASVGTNPTYSSTLLAGNHTLVAVFQSTAPTTFTLTVNSTPISGVPVTVEAI